MQSQDSTLPAVVEEAPKDMDLTEVTNEQIMEMIDRGISAMDMVEGQLRTMLAVLRDRQAHLEFGGKRFDVWAAARWDKSARRIRQLLEESDIQTALLETAKATPLPPGKDTNDEQTITKLSGRALRAAVAVDPADPGAALGVVREAAETGETIPSIVKARTAPALPPKGETIAEKVKRLSCREEGCGHPETNHVALALGRGICQAFIAGTGSRCDCKHYVGPEAASHRPYDAPLVLEPSEPQADTRFMTSIRDLHMELNTAEARLGMEQLASSPENGRMAAIAIDGLIGALDRAKAVLVPSSEPVAVEA